MTTNDWPEAEDEFAALLAQYDTELEQGSSVNSGLRFRAIADPPLADRLEKAGACLQMLNRLWPAPTTGDEEFAPESVDRFQIIRPLGRGGFGVVYLAFDPNLRRHVALKVQRPETVLSASLRRRFLREAEAAASLNHPHIVTVFEVGEASLLTWIAAEFCDGMSVAAWLEKNRTPAPPRQAADLVAKLAEAVAYAHSRGILHRDIKPSNILLVKNRTIDSASLGTDDSLRNYQPKLTDFGLAKLLDEQSSETCNGTLLGTPGYMAPEQLEGRVDKIGPAADVYGLGLVLYELLTAEPLFSGATAARTMQTVLSQEAKFPRQHARRIPRDLKAIVLQAIEKEPARRYRSAAELAVDLQRYLDDEPVVARRPGIVEKTVRKIRHRPALTAAAVLGVAALIAFFVARHYANLNHSLLVPTITLATEPPDARVVFVPVDPMTWEPKPEGKVVAHTRSPVREELNPGYYLVVAALDDGRFHEVYRHVPKNDHSDFPGGGSWNRWKVLSNGGIELHQIQIPPKSAAEGMAFIPSSNDDQGRKNGQEATPGFFMDTHEFTEEGWRTLVNDHKYNPAFSRGLNFATALNFDEALNTAEKLGKRLPTAAEYDTALQHVPAAARVESSDSNLPVNIPPVGTSTADATDTSPPIIGLCSNVAEWTTARSEKVQKARFEMLGEIASDHRIVRGGDLPTLFFGLDDPQRSKQSAGFIPDGNGYAVLRLYSCPGIGFRCVRSVAPRFLDDDSR